MNTNSQLLDQIEKQAARIGELRTTIVELRAALEETYGWVLTPEQYSRLGHPLENAAELRAHMTTVDALLERTKP